ncbi:hypothetical protein ACFRCG_06905 [Embleya sp. NPDC056575]|uniref:hypothetical protein n=1 Tax=unclassified Embleya TaxID=2699296 RepID=UPI00367840B6
MRKKIATMAVAGGVALALTTPLVGTAQAASNITRKSACAQFSGNYSYWHVGSWFGYELTGRITQTCTGGGWHTLVISGEANSGNRDYKTGASTYLEFTGQSRSIGTFSESGGVKNIRIALVDGMG